MTRKYFCLRFQNDIRYQWAIALMVYDTKIFLFTFSERHSLSVGNGILYDTKIFLFTFSERHSLSVGNCILYDTKIFLLTFSERHSSSVTEGN